ncbi:chemotaxis-specific protein-glutamate methyltransferase CheB [Roseofilum reptotaenium CS-1145]|uniref:Protein-glutamate methylesterase/protein-glutamine glutaminase n=1 Tax=Roseofilum reptotaenium AO1-A TaxID=1925591 RepID=A0A1L9QVM2_9CYAN|nr:chemotaxis-specific protein-glutamate methyltransferase CheB [Roseofilum reptotaenium]MDB9520214.1 chemotaxis-specific protein-glutamate methyltransferase CheB [Roseofilum reptotaenium CS-1145]OJJ26741.1 chemotaxis response regulator protein-glutamate methylesterase [Roseofilum reptotaenium AO1-A]
MRIAIAHHGAIATATLQRMLEGVADYQVIWTASDGAEAVVKCHQNRPDLILMDLDLPAINGVEATRQIMKQSPCAILIVTANAKQKVAQVYAAIEQGAIDAVDRPVLSGVTPNSADRLLSKVAKVGKLLKPTPSKSFHSLPKRSPPLVAIGASTGGPKALATILSQLPVNFRGAIVIVQHVDAQFSSGLVDWLRQQTPLPVRIAASGDRLLSGTVLVAGTNDHLYLKPNLTLAYTRDPRHNPYRPSVDVFFKSLAQHYTHQGIAVLLTGMGRDGAEGLQLLKGQGWHTIAQDRHSCVVYGMPKAAIELEAAIEVLSLDAIPKGIMSRMGRWGIVR